MNRIVYVVLLAALLCSSTHAETPVPDFVVKLADAHLESLESTPDDLAEARKRFCTMFLWGCTDFAHLEVPDDSFPPEMAGVNAAVRYRNDHPDSMHRVLTGYGYERLTIEGKWRTGFEMSQFVNKDVAKPGWWLSHSAGCKEGNLNWKHLPKLKLDYNTSHRQRKLIDDHRGAEADIRVTGYLSPIGEYGHLNSYSRELLATKIEPPNGDANNHAGEAGGRSTRNHAYRAYDGQRNPTEGTDEPSDAPKDRASSFDNGKSTPGPR